MFNSQQYCGEWKASPFGGGTFKKGLTPEDFAIKKPNQAARARDGKYPECNCYLRMLAAFSLVMSFTGTTMFLVTGLPARWS